MGKLEDTFNLPDAIEDIEKTSDQITKSFEEDSDNDINFDIDHYNDKMEMSLEEYANIKDYSKEMDEISEKTLTEFTDIVALGKDVEPRHAGEMFSSAAQMAKISLDARNNKMTAKLKLLELQLRKQRNDLLAEKQKATLPEDHDNTSDDDTTESKEVTRDDLLEIAERLKKS